jgi:hypothetical protein
MTYLINIPSQLGRAIKGVRNRRALPQAVAAGRIGLLLGLCPWRVPREGSPRARNGLCWLRAVRRRREGEVPRTPCGEAPL